MPTRPRTTHIVVHTCADGRKHKGEHVDTPPEDVTAWHTDPKPRGRGWSRVGYHFLVRKSGTVHKLLAEAEKGIHCRDKGMNSKALGIAPAWKMAATAAQADSADEKGTSINAW